MTSNGRLAKLEGDLALQKSFSEEVKKSQSGIFIFKNYMSDFYFYIHLCFFLSSFRA